MPADGVWNFILWLHYLALSLWIGGIIVAGAVAAPVAHRSIASKAVAAAIVSDLFKKLNAVEITCCMLLLVTTASSFRFVQIRQNLIYDLIYAIVFMGLVTVFYTFRITPQLEKIREEVPTLDALSEGHESKKEFNRLHKTYVRLMSLNLVLGLGVLYGSVVLLK